MRIIITRVLNGLLSPYSLLKKLPFTKVAYYRPSFITFSLTNMHCNETGWFFLHCYISDHMFSHILIYINLTQYDIYRSLEKCISKRKVHQF